MTRDAARPSFPLTLAGYNAFVLIDIHLVLVPTLIRSIGHDFAQSDA